MDDVKIAPCAVQASAQTQSLRGARVASALMRAVDVVREIEATGLEVIAVDMDAWRSRSRIQVRGKPESLLRFGAVIVDVANSCKSYWRLTVVLHDVEIALLAPRQGQA